MHKMIKFLYDKAGKMLTVNISLHILQISKVIVPHCHGKSYVHSNDLWSVQRLHSTRCTCIWFIIIHWSDPHPYFPIFLAWRSYKPCFAYLASFRGPFSAFHRLLQFLSKGTLKRSKGIKGRKTVMKELQKLHSLSRPVCTEVQTKCDTNAEKFDVVLTRSYGKYSQISNMLRMLRFSRQKDRHLFLWNVFRNFKI